MIKGIDVYHGDGRVDWAKVKAAGIEFAYVKATQGASFHDPEHLRNAEAAREAGVLVGCYHFFEPTFNGAAQAKHFLERAGGREGLGGQLIPALDVEKQGGMSKHAHTESVRAWLEVVEAEIGRKPVIYCSPDYANSRLDPVFGAYPLWLAMWATQEPSGKVGGWDRWTFWQHSATGDVRGVPVTGGVDLNVFAGTMEDLRALVLPRGADATLLVKVVDHASGRMVAAYRMVPGGNHVADQGKLYVDGS